MLDEASTPIALAQASGRPWAGMLAQEAELCSPSMASITVPGEGWTSWSPCKPDHACFMTSILLCLYNKGHGPQTHCK